jgi:hypothetical protein
MMMVMTMMEVDLHLKNYPKEAGSLCQISYRRHAESRILGGGWIAGEFKEHNGICVPGS